MTDTPQLKRDVVPTAYREKYKDKGGTTGDLVAVELQRVANDGLPALQSVMKENDIPTKKWATQNLGQQRMNLSNVLRGRLYKGASITILGKQYNINHMADDYGRDVLKDTDASIQKFAEKYNLLTTSPARVISAIRKTFFADAEKARKKAEADEARKHKTEAAAQKKANADAEKQKRAEAKTAADAEKARKKADNAAKPKTAAKAEAKQKVPEPA